MDRDLKLTWPNQEKPVFSSQYFLYSNVSSFYVDFFEMLFSMQ